MLTQREQQILCMAEMSNRQIAQRLGISPQSVTNHFHNIYNALGIRGSGRKRAKAVMAALRCGHITMSQIDAAQAPRRHGWPKP